MERELLLAFGLVALLEGAILLALLLNRKGQPVAPQVIVMREGKDGASPEILQDLPLHEAAHTAYRPYNVGYDGVVEFADGERVEPDVTKIRPPDMRVVG